jgi:polyhydroxybutyrate depolymerase
MRWVSIGIASCIVAHACDARADRCSHVAGHATCTLEHQGRTREYRLYIPAHVASPAPVVLNLHGRKGTAREQEPRLVEAAEREGFIVVSPQGIERSWNAGVGFGPAHDEGIDDVGFVRAVIADLDTASATPIDHRRVYATGLSNGGRMVHRLACEASDVIAAVASVAGPIADRDDTTRAFECKPARAVPVMIIHGTADRCTPYAGGEGLDTHGNVATPATAAEWAARDACTSTTTHALGSTTCEVHRDCEGGAEVALCTIDGGGHVWPGGPKFTLWQACGGSWPDDFRASDQMWSFFVAHPMDAQARWQPLAVAPPARTSGLSLGPVDSVELPFDHSQLALSLRGTAPSTFDASGRYQDASVALAGAVSLYSTLHVRGSELSGFRVMAQFRAEGERVAGDLLGSDQQVTKASLGLTALYLAPSANLYALYAGAAIAETADTIAHPQLMPTAIGIGTYRASERVTWIYGGGFGYALGRPWLLPAAGLMWTPRHDWVVTTILPVFADVRHELTARLFADVLLSVAGDRFNFENQGVSEQLRLGEARLALGITYRWNQHWSWRGELGFLGPRYLTIADASATVMTDHSKGAGYLSTQVSYAFGNAPR